MERMGSLDAVFIAVEDEVNHMHIGSVGVFEGPAPSYDAVRALAASKLQLVPRYRQRVREAPASIGRPLWIDDANFDLDYHLRHTAVPTRDRHALEELVGRVMSQPLDRHRPLWEMWVIEGLADDRWAVVSKVHHCMVDGIAGSDLLGVIMDPRPDAPLLPPEQWAPAPEPSRFDLAWYTSNMAVASAWGFARDGVHALVASVSNVEPDARGRRRARKLPVPITPGRFIAHRSDRTPSPLGPHASVARRHQDHPRCVRRHRQRRRTRSSHARVPRTAAHAGRACRRPHDHGPDTGVDAKPRRSAEGSTIASPRSTHGFRSACTTLSRLL